MSTLPFILHLRHVCETIFDVMLSTHICGLEAYQKRSKENGEKQGGKRPSLDGWNLAPKFAQDALAMFRKAEDKCQRGDVHSANDTVEKALLSLKDRYSIHRFHLLFLTSVLVQMQFQQCTFQLTGWDDAEVEKRTVSFLYSFLFFDEHGQSATCRSLSSDRQCDICIPYIR